MSKIDRIKKHLSDNKKVYIVGATSALIGATVATVVLVKRGNAQIVTQPIQALTWKSVQTIEVYVEALGDPGNIIQDMTTGTIYASQGQAARELGVSPARISEHLAGKLSTVKGHRFSKLGKAAVSS